MKLWMSDGDREDMLAGDFVRFDGDDWPIPGTRWESLALDPARSGTASSLNDGSLELGAARADAARSPIPRSPSPADEQRPAQRRDRRRAAASTPSTAAVPAAHAT